MNASNDLSCNEMVEMITEYLEGTMPLEERARFEAHLEICSGCRTYLEQMRQTIHWVGRLSEVQLLPGVQEILLESFRGWKKQDP